MRCIYPVLMLTFVGFSLQNTSVVLRALQRQVSLFLAATLTVLNGRDMASSCIFQKGHCIQNTEWTSKLDSMGSSISQMIYSLLVVYTGYAVLKSLQSRSILKSNTVHYFMTPPNLQAFGLLQPSVLRQNFRTNSECWRKECLHQRVHMAALKYLSSPFLQSFMRRSGECGHIGTTADCTTLELILILGMWILSSHSICKQPWQ